MDYQPLVEKFKQEHYIKGNSQRTIDGYAGNCIRIFQYLQKHPFAVTEKDLKSFILHLKRTDRKPATCNLYIYSIKSFYDLFSQNGRENPAANLSAHKPGQQIPNILNTEEVKAILNSPKNLKHKAILTVAYSAGLRLSEICGLKPADIDSGRMTIKVNGKGARQRQTLLAPYTLDLLRAYYKTHKPKVWLFEGWQAGIPISHKTCQVVFKDAAEKAGINKHVTIHTLRHCFATHLMDAGVSLKVIQKLLGHKFLQTTSIYTHVSRKMISNIASPINHLNLTMMSSEERGGRHA